MSRGTVNHGTSFRVRAWFVFGVLTLGAGSLVAKAVHLQLSER